MSRANLEHFARAIPRLEAQETLNNYQATALASGNVKREAARAALRHLERAAQGAQRQDAYRPRTRTERHNLLAGLGVRVNG